MLDNKSTIEEIKERFDHDVARFSLLEMGQQTTIDAPLAMELITEAAVSSNPAEKRILDIGCGAGNNSLKLLQKLNLLDCDLVDLSQPMLDKAVERLNGANSGQVRAFQGDFRTVQLPAERYDIVLAAAVLHHLRDEDDWRTVFQKIFDLTAPGGSFWITDLISHENGMVQQMMWSRYGHYLEMLGGVEYKEKVFAYVEKEDSPRSVTFQLTLLQEVGFVDCDILHKNSCFAAFGAHKPNVHGN
ncbi:MAG: class I SAM-dependent methyltransferase [Methylococcales bacterium]|nr:class I SAM-dependent methyltransferase [Methylococcales bacterium]